MKNIETTVVTDTTQPQRVQRTTEVVENPIREQSPQKAYETKKTIFRAYQIIWYILAVLEVLFAFRFVFKALGANPFSGFVSLIYSITDPLTFPFQGILGQYTVGNTIFEWSTIIAGVVYALIAWGIVYLFQMIKPVSPEEVSQEVDNP